MKFWGILRKKINIFSYLEILLNRIYFFLWFLAEKKEAAYDNRTFYEIEDLHVKQAKQK